MLMRVCLTVELRYIIQYTQKKSLLRLNIVHLYAQQFYLRVVCSFIPLICVCISTLRTSLTKQSSFTVMGRSKLNNEEKVRVLMLANEGMSNRDICIRTGRSMQTIRMLKKVAVGLPPNTIPERKKGSGRPRKTSKRTDAMLKREVMVSPTVTAGNAPARSGGSVAANHPASSTKT